MENRVIAGKDVQADAIYRAGSTVVDIRPEGIDNGEPGIMEPFVPALEAIICYDSKMNIIWVNDYVRHLFGMPNEQIKTGKCYEMLCKKQSHCAGCPVVRTFETDSEHVAKIMTAGGKTMFVSSYPLRDENGFLSGVVEVVKPVSSHPHHQDVTDAYVFGSRMSLLTDREREVMHLVADGCQNKVIGTKLGISPKTVEIHRARVMDKLQIRSTAQLVRYLTKYEIFGRFITE